MLKFALFLTAATALFGEIEDRVRQNIPAQSATRVSVTAEFGSIRVDPGITQAVDVDVWFRGDPSSRQEFDRMLKDFALEVTNTGGEIRVSGRFKNGWQSRGIFGNNGGNWCHDNKCLEYSWLKRIEYRVTVPPQFSADLKTSGGSITVGDLKGSATAATSGGSLTFGRIEGAVRGNTSGGSITMTGTPGRADVRTSGGSIRITETVGEIDASTSGGSIHIEKTTGPVRAHTSGGSITVRQASGAVDAGTSGGGIDVALTPTKGFDLDAETSGGRVTSDFSVLTNSTDRRNEHLRGPVNGGGPVVRLRTSGGSIRIRKSS